MRIVSEFDVKEYVENVGVANVVEEFPTLQEDGTIKTVYVRRAVSPIAVALKSAASTPGRYSST